MIYDLLIIGAGPSGLYAWNLATNFKLTGNIIESSNNIGGQPLNLYPDKFIHNIPGTKEIKSIEFIYNLYNSIEKTDQFTLMSNIEIQSITQLEYNEDNIKKCFEVSFSNGEIKKYKFILCSFGAGKNEVIKLIDDEIPNVIYTITDLKKYENKNILVFGGGDGAIDAALHLSKSNNVTIIHRRDEFRNENKSILDLEDKNVNILTPYIFEKITQKEKGLIKEIEVKNVNDESRKKMKLDYIVVQFGQTISKTGLVDIHLEKNNLNRIIVSASMATSVEQIFAIGDCVDYEFKSRNLLSSFYESSKAMFTIEKILKNKKIATNGW